MKALAVFGADDAAASLIAGLHESRSISPDHLLHAVPASAPGRTASGAAATRCSPTDPRLADAEGFILTAGADTITSFPPTTAQWTRGKPVLSAIPGFTLRRLGKRFPDASLVVRFACSDSVRFARGVSALACPPDANAAAVAAVAGLFGALGRSFSLVEEEIDAAATVLRTSGPLLYELAASIVDAATDDGLDPLLAHELAVHTLFGAGALLEASRMSPEVLVGRLRPGRSEAAAALECLEQRGFRSLVRRALAEAAARRGGRA